MPPERSHELRGMLFILASVLLWSTAEVVTRTIVGKINPFQVATARFVIAGVCLAPFLHVELKRRRLRLTPGILLHALWLSCIGIVGSSTLYQYSLDYAGAGTIATIFGTMPIWVLTLSRVFLGTAFSVPMALGVSSGFVGIAILSSSERSTTFSLPGLLLAFGSVICFSLFTVFVKRFAARYAGLPFTALTVIIGAIVMVPMAAIQGDTVALDHLREVFWPVLYLGAGTTAVGYYLYFTGLEAVDPTRAASAILLKPPLAVALAWLVLSEPVTWRLAIALAMVLLGLYLVNASPRPAMRLRPQSAGATE